MENNKYILDYIKNNGLITVDFIKSNNDIIELIEKSENSLNKLLFNIINTKVKLIFNGKRYGYVSNEINDVKEFGIFHKSILCAQYNNFGGGEIFNIMFEDKYYFSPKIWFGTLSISYSLIDGGSNGMPVLFYTDKNKKSSGSIYFDVLKSEFVINSII